MAKPALLKHIRKSGCASRIHMSGYVNNAPEILAACDVCVLPSLKREGLPRSVIEGMAYATPPIVTNSGGSPELVDHEKNGLIIEPGSAKEIEDAILRFYSDPDFRLQAGAAARETIASKFTVEQTVHQTFELYKQLYAQKKAAGSRP
jgi:glycosyltransferase involved in cell wall biosynthesis